MAGYAPKLPLEINKKDGAYVLIQNRKELIQQNLKALLLTNPGERIMDTEYGVGIRRVLFEMADKILIKNLKNLIQRQINVYMPFVVLVSVDTSEPREPGSEYALAVRLRYYISPLDESDQLILIL